MIERIDQVGETFRIRFREDIDQENDEPLDTINEYLYDLFGYGLREYEELNIDWRDSKEVWVTVVITE